MGLLRAPSLWRFWAALTIALHLAIYLHLPRACAHASRLLHPGRRARGPGRWPTSCKGQAETTWCSNATSAWQFLHALPRHRKLISINKRYTGKTNAEFNLRYDWNFCSATDLGCSSDTTRTPLSRRQRHGALPERLCRAVGLYVLYNTTIAHAHCEHQVIGVAWNGHYFIQTTTGGRHTSVGKELAAELTC